MWYTSGVRNPSNPSYYAWEGDGTNLRFDLSFWNNNGQQQNGDIIAYDFNGKLYIYMMAFVPLINFILLTFTNFILVGENV